MSCAHDVCKLNSAGVAVCIVDPRMRCVLVGRERFGKYAGRYNICSGGAEADKDVGCIVNTAMRELREEMKLRFDNVDAFLRMFTSSKTGRLRYFVLGSTPVLIGWCDSKNVCLNTIKYHMRLDIERNSPPCYCEMDDVKWVTIAEDTTELSRLAVAVMKRLRLPDVRQSG